MITENTLIQTKNEINKEFEHIAPVDMPGIAIIYNDENESIVNCVNILKEDCEDVKFNYFSTRVNSETDESFFRRMIDDYTEMEDVTIILIILPLPKNYNKTDLFNLHKDSKYKKLNIVELYNNSTTLGARITTLSMVKESYSANK